MSDLKLDVAFFKDLENKRSRGELPSVMISMNERDIGICLGQLKELGVSRRDIAKFLIKQIRDIWG